MLPGIDIMGCQNLEVPASVMRHVVHVESGANPYAIGVVGGRLARQPKNLDEAVATVRMLEAKGYNFSLGIAQVNRKNLDKHGLDTHEKAFDPCANLLAGSRILADCHASAGGDWGKAFSCYYSGNFVTGFEHGYVQKIYDSISRGRTVAEDTISATAIPVREPARPAASSTRAKDEKTKSARTDVFVPRVRGPHEPRATSTTSHETQTSRATSTRLAAPSDLREGSPDTAFVF